MNALAQDDHTDICLNLYMSKENASADHSYYLWYVQMQSNEMDSKLFSCMDAFSENARFSLVQVINLNRKASNVSVSSLPHANRAGRSVIFCVR